MPRLQYPNPNKAFKLFTDASKHSCLGILHQEEVSDQVNAIPNLFPIAYFWAHSAKHNNCGTPPKGSVMQFTGQFKNFLFYLSGTKCTLNCDHKLFALFFTVDMSSPVLDHWTLELQQFDIQFKYISGKKNIVADAISRLRTLGLYQENGNDNLAKQMMMLLTMA